MGESWRISYVFVPLSAVLIWGGVLYILRAIEQVDTIDFQKPCDRIRSFNFPCEEHKVITEDGHILTVFRIPYGRSSKSNKTNKLPLYLMHGAGVSSEFWTIGTPKLAFAYLFAEAGYDVWLGNARGNEHALGHVNKTITQEEFWNFSYDEVGLYDIPATIDYILRETGQKKLHYVGHSMGAGNFFASLSNRPEYNSKIRVMVGLSPGGYFAHMTSALQIFYPIIRPVVKPIYAMFGWYYTLSYSKTLSYLVSSICCKEFLLPYTKYCWVLLFGIDDALFNPMTVPSFFARFPGKTSLNMVEQLIQWREKGEFTRYDFGSADKNIDVYGQDMPPSHDIRKVTVPVVLFYGEGDTVVAAEDVKRLAGEVPNLVDLIRVDDPSFNHVDFVLADKAPSLVLEQVLPYLSKY